MCGMCVCALAHLCVWHICLIYACRCVDAQVPEFISGAWGGCQVASSMALCLIPSRQCLPRDHERVVLTRLAGQQAAKVCLLLPTNSEV